MTPLSPMSAPSAGESCEEAADNDERPRLQRSHGPSKKTFKFRRSRYAKPEVMYQILYPRLVNRKSTIEFKLCS